VDSFGEVSVAVGRSWIWMLTAVGDIEELEEGRRKKCNDCGIYILITSQVGVKHAQHSRA
jgi:hypothetical protein